ncbi:energy transducer TonB [Aquimonas voraii]|uniref:Protein TonB n=1 Tax=Aquimonas voraii TaxID=265719 RepID=A0A1G6WK77_9GAMM|nr:energy transducer TonB [Aquimonas voraii]SDD65627.1 outer membrane transport energization protein TonB [Aquimonas voraii]
MRIRTKRLPMTGPRQAFRFGTGLCLLSFALLLGACSGDKNAPAEERPAEPNSTDLGSKLQSAAPVSAIAAGDAAERGEIALREQRLFVPAGDNAFELFLAAVEARPEDERSRLALQDLLPYAALHVEQRLAANDADGAERVLALLVRASSDAPALPRLQAGLAALREREANTRDAAGRAAAPTAVPAAPAPAPAASVSDPTPSAAPSPPASPVLAVASEPGPQPPPLEPVEQAAAAASPAPSRAEPAPLAQPVPEVVYRPPLRYPAMAERRRLEGFVEIEFTIGADGSVSQLEILRSQPEDVFDREALAAMQRWRFAPPAAPMRARRTLEFKLAR